MYDEILKSAVETIRLEGEAVLNLVNLLDQDFAEVTNLIHQSGGRVVLTGIGKSANIANKIVSTLNSTGTPAMFMHAADAIHGDLGMIQKDDVVLALSKSGNTPEIKVLIPLVKGLGNTLVALVGNRESELGKQADYILDCSVEKEACPNNLAPTSSTTTQLVMGDALAVSLMYVRGFGSSDFARYHPGGALGKKLYLRVGDLLDDRKKALVGPEDSLKVVISEISSKRMGAAVVVEQGEILGVVTDGDIRRMLEKEEDFATLKASDFMSPNPKIIEADSLAVAAFRLMEENGITQLVVTRDGKYAGLVHLHDILKEGIY